MANWQSDQITAQGGIPGPYGVGSGGIYAPLDTSVLTGRMRVARFSWTVPSGVNTGDILFACQIPTAATILKSFLYASSASFAATAVQVGFSDGVAADAYVISGVGGVSLATTTEVVMGNTYASVFPVAPGQTPAPNTPGTSGNPSAGQPGPALLEMVPVILTFTSTAPAATYGLLGFFEYVVD